MPDKISANNSVKAYCGYLSGMNNKASYLVWLCHIARPVGKGSLNIGITNSRRPLYCGGGEILLESLGDMEKVRTFVAVVWE